MLLSIIDIDLTRRWSISTHPYFLHVTSDNISGGVLILLFLKQEHFLPASQTHIIRLIVCDSSIVDTFNGSSRSSNKLLFTVFFLATAAWTPSETMNIE